MRLLTLLALLLFPLLVAAQYPNTPGKTRLGYGTTADGLVYRGSGAPATTPTGFRNYAYFHYDTLSAVLYKWDHVGAAWVVAGDTADGTTILGAGTAVSPWRVDSTTLIATKYDLTLVDIVGAISAANVTYGTGTDNYIPFWLNDSTLSNSPLYFDYGVTGFIGFSNPAPESDFDMSLLIGGVSLPRGRTGIRPDPTYTIRGNTENVKLEFKDQGGAWRNIATETWVENYLSSENTTYGNGTVNYLPKWLNDSTLTNSIAQDNGSLFSITGGLTLTDVTSLSGDSVLVWRGNRVYYRAKSSLLSGYPTGSGTSGYVARWTGTSTMGTGALQDNGTVVTVNDGNTGTAKPFGFDTWTTAARPTGVTGQAGYNTTLGYAEIYGSSSWQQLMLPEGTSNRLLYFNGTSWVQTSSGLTWDGTYLSSQRIRINGATSSEMLNVAGGSYLTGNTKIGDYNNAYGRLTVTAALTAPSTYGGAANFGGRAARKWYKLDSDLTNSSEGAELYSGETSGWPTVVVQPINDVNIPRIDTRTLGSIGVVAASFASGGRTTTGIYGVTSTDQSGSYQSSNYAYGVIGRAYAAVADSSSGPLVGVYGWAQGQYGANAARSIYGVQGKAVGLSSQAIYGVLASATGGGTNWGVYSEAGANYFADNVGIKTTNPSYALDMGSATGGARLPNGTTAQRPTGAAAVERFNTDTLFFEGHNGTSWLAFASRNWVRANFAPIASGYTGWTLAGDTGSETISSGNTATFTGGWGIVTAASATDVLTIRADSSEVATQYDISDRPSGRGEGVAMALAYWTDANTLDAFPWYYDAGNVGLGLLSPLYSLDGGNKTDGFRLPNGTTAQRPTGANGVMRYNSTTGYPEVYFNSAWNNIGISNNIYTSDGTLAGDRKITQNDYGLEFDAGAGYWNLYSSDGDDNSSVYAYPSGITIEAGVQNVSVVRNGRLYVTDNGNYSIAGMFALSNAFGGYHYQVTVDTVNGFMGWLSGSMADTLWQVMKNGDFYFSNYDDTKRDSAAHLIGIQEATGKLVPIAQVNAKYMEDSDLTLTAAEIYKFQEVRVWMSTTAGATSQTELTIPDAAQAYLNTKIVVVSKDASGTYNNLINTPMATMYDAGSDASSYPVAAGKTVVLWCVQTGASSYRWAIQQ